MASYGTSSYSFKNIFSYITDIAKSALVNSYGIFHPRGPYFLLSIHNAWKKFKPKNNFFHSLGFLQSSKRLASTYVNDRIILFLIPLGGSYVIFIPLISNVTGNTFDGIDVNHILKSGLTSDVY